MSTRFIKTNFMFPFRTTYSKAHEAEAQSQARRVDHIVQYESINHKMLFSIMKKRKCFQQLYFLMVCDPNTSTIRESVIEKQPFVFLFTNSTCQLNYQTSYHYMFLIIEFNHFKQSQWKSINHKKSRLS